jgi:RNA polymerase sigma-70 factor (ECF subfamily)
VRQPESLRSWIYGIVRRTVKSHRRAGQRRQQELSMPPEDSPVAARQASPLELTEQSSQLELLSSLLAGLTEAKREVFVLAEMEQMTIPEIAEALEIPVNTAYSRLRHARQEFEAALSRQLAASKKRRLA